MTILYVIVYKGQKMLSWNTDVQVHTVSSWHIQTQVHELTYNKYLYTHTEHAACMLTTCQDMSYIQELLENYNSELLNLAKARSRIQISCEIGLEALLYTTE